jgi:phage tail-like protein
MADAPPMLALQAFRFVVWLTRSPTLTTGIPDRAQDAPTGTEQLGDGGFQECSGLDIEADIREYLEGGRNDSIIRRVGRVKLQPIVLKRGMFATPEPPPDSPGSGPAGGRVIPDLWVWLQDMVRGQLPVRRFDGLVAVRGPSGVQPRATWRFVRGLPVKLVGPTLNARTGELAIEELHIAHEGLWLATQ